MGTIQDFYWEEVESGRRVIIPSGNIIPDIIPSPFISKLPDGFARDTNFKEIGTDPFPGKRKRFIIKYRNNEEDHFPESPESHRNIHINF